MNGMKKVVVSVAAILLALMSSATVSAEALAQADRDSAMKYLEKTKQTLEETVKGLSEAQWNFKPGPDRWSVAQVLEHIGATEDTLRGFIEEKVLKAPAAADRDVKQIDAMVLAAIPDRTHKFQAPQELQPTGRFGSPADTLKHFLETRAKTEELLKKTPDLRGHAVDSPIGQKLDAYEWILFIGAHSERHTKQIKEVIADPNFPKQ